MHTIGQINRNPASSAIKKARVIAALAILPMYFALAGVNRKTIWAPVFYAVFALAQLTSVAHPLGNYFSPASGFLLNYFLTATTGYHRSPLLFVFIVPVLTYSIDKDDTRWPLAVAVVNTLAFASFVLRALTTSDIHGAVYATGVCLLMWIAFALMRQLDSALKRQFMDLFFASQIDNLTGLHNRNALDAKAKELIARSIPFGLLFFDVNDFKKLNDQEGHLAGDNVLKGFGKILKEQIRKEDFAFRYGGDEFVLLLPGVDRATGVTTGKRIQNALKYKHGMTASFGVAVYPGDGRTFEDLLRVADEELYQHKN